MVISYVMSVMRAPYQFSLDDVLLIKLPRGRGELLIVKHRQSHSISYVHV